MMESDTSPAGENGSEDVPAPAAIGAQPDYAGSSHEHHEIKGDVFQPTNELRMTEAWIRGNQRPRKQR